jgi:hypothetical protein
MQITDKKYYIIETPAVQIGNIKTYNFNLDTLQINNIQFNSTSSIYYSDIISENALTECKQFNRSNTSNILSIPVQPPNNNYTTNGPYSVYDLSKYISNKLLAFSGDLQLVNKCNLTSSTQSMSSDCTTIFKGYTTGGNTNTTLPAYKDPVDTINFPNRKKHLIQQANDLNQLIFSFTTIINYWKSTASSDISQEVLNNYQHMLSMRNDLDMKLGEIYRYNDSKIVQSEHSLDRTVYTNVVLTILATSLIYIVLIKL